MKNFENNNSKKSYYDHNMLGEIISDLSHYGKLATYMYYYECMSCHEIAAVLNISVVEAEDIVERCQEYIVSETGTPETLELLQDFYIKDIKKRVHSETVSEDVNKVVIKSP